MRTDAILVLLFALILAVMLFVSSVTRPASVSYERHETCVALLGCNRP